MKRKTKLLLAVAFVATLFTSSSLSAQSCTGNFLSDDFSNPALWTPMGTNTITGYSTVTYPPGDLYVDPSSQTLRYDNFRGRQTHRLVRNIGCTLSSTDAFRAEFEFVMGNSIDDYGAHPFLLSENTLAVYSDSSGSQVKSINSFVQVFVGDPFGSGSHQLTAQIRGRYQDLAQTGSDPINLVKNVKYYFRVERITADKAVLSIYSDSSYSNHITGSPVCYDLDERITGLQYLQYGVSTTSSPTRTADIEIDNLEMYDNTIENCFRCTGNFLSDDFSNPALWAPMGTNTITGYSTVTYPSGDLYVDPSSQTLRYDNFRGRQTHRLVRNIGCSLSSTDVFRAEFDFIMDNSPDDYGAHPFLLSENTLAIYSDASGSTIKSNNSFIQVFVGDPFGSGSHQLTAQIRGRYQDLAQTGSDPINLMRNVKYYFRVQRLDADKAQLSIFSDAGYTTHIAGSPVCYDLDERITGLQFLQYGVSTTSSPTRTANLEIDNLELYDNTIGNCFATCNVVSSLEINYLDCEYEFTNTSQVGTGNTFMGSVIDFNDLSYEDISLGGSLLHSYNSSGNYSPCITTFSYIFDGEKYVCCSNTSCLDDEKYFEDCEREDNSKLLFEEQQCEIDANFTARVDCEGKVFFDNSTNIGGTNYLTTVVDFGDGNGPIEVALGQDFNHQYSQNGTYTVCMTVFGYSYNDERGFDCCSEEYCFTVNVNTIEEPCESDGGWGFGKIRSTSSINEALITIAPNPVVDNLRITLQQGLNELSIFSVDGKLIEYFIVQDQSEKTLNMEEYHSGIYFITVKNGNKIETKKIVK